MRILIACMSVMVLSACELLAPVVEQASPVEVADDSYLCETPENVDVYEEYCSLQVWTELAIKASETKWSVRHEQIKALGDEPKQKLMKILLSQNIDTPYTNRLRAQNWLMELKPTMDQKMARVISILIETPSQQLLELESAITILSRVNARQEKTIVDLQETLNVRSAEIEKQKSQVEQLLKIEANMSENKRSN